MRGLELNWPGKEDARAQADIPIDKSLQAIPGPAQGPGEQAIHRFIEGDNLDALKLLQDELAGKVRLIYIDPPYNTGRNFSYHDRFVDSADWLNMMLPRLLLARPLLREDGAIMISMDENELPALWLLCDEIFGKENFVECLVYEKKAAPKGVPPANMIVGVHEYMLCYQKSPSFRFKGRPRSEEGFHNPDQDPRGPWRNTNCKSTVKDASKAFSIVDPATGRVFTDTWAHSPAEMERMTREGILIFPRKPDGQVRKKEYLNLFKNSNVPIRSALGLYDAQKSTQELQQLLGGKFFINPKSLRLMQDLVQWATSDDDLILDFFGGSGTTGHAVLAANANDGQSRRFVLVQQAESFPEQSAARQAGYNHVADLCAERIDRAGQQLLDREHHSEWDRLIAFQKMWVSDSHTGTVAINQPAAKGLTH